MEGYDFSGLVIAILLKRRRDGLERTQECRASAEVKDM
jgi:hypothetical protein